MTDRLRRRRPAARSSNPGSVARPRPIVLVVLDGFGIGRDPAADAIAAAPMPVWRGPARALAARRPASVGGTPSACRPARWATRRSATSTSGPASPFSRTCPGSTRPWPTARSSSARRCSPPAPGRPGRVAGSTSSGWSARAASMPTIVTSSRSPELAASTGRARGPRPCPARRAGHAAALGRLVHRRPRAPARGGASGCPDRDGRRPLLRDGPRPSLGADRPAATRRSSTGRGSGALGAGGGRGRRLRPWRERRVRPADDHRRASTGWSATATPIVHANFRADRARQLTHALVDAAFDGFDRTGPDGRPAPRDLFVVTMTEYEAGLPVEVAFGPGGGPVARRRPSRRRAGARSTSPRPRSTPTSRTSSTAAGRRPGPARIGCSSRVRRSRPTTCSPR